MRWAIILRTAIVVSVLLLHSACERAASPPAGKENAAQSAPPTPVRTLVEAPPQGMNLARDAEEAHEVLEFISSHYVSDQEPTFYRSGGTNATHIHVYGVLVPSEQDKIVGLVQAEISKRNWKQIYIIFRDQERWTDLENGWRGRSGERDLYSVVIRRL